MILLAALSLFRAQPGAPAKLVEKMIVEDVSKSQTSVYASLYSVDSDKLFQAFNERSKQKIPVHLVVDAVATRSLKKRLVPTINLARFLGKGHMHHKLFAIDNRISWIGSANLTKRVHEDENLMHRIESEKVADFIAHKIESLKTPGKKQDFPHKTFQINDQTLEFWFLPDNPDASIRIKDLIRSARKSVKVAMYTFTRQDFAKELVKAKERGVRVQVILDNSSCAGCPQVIDILKEGHSEVKIHPGPGLCHHKFALIDDKTLAHGSANWTRAAFNDNEDFFVVLSPLNSKEAQLINGLFQDFPPD